MTKLFKNNEKDSILIIKNQNSGMIHLRVVKEKEKTSEVWQDCWNCTWKLYGLSKKIRTDRKTVFMNKWWKEQIKKNKIHHYKTIAYYSKSNGLVKHTNKEIKKYLRKYINHEQNDWKTWLPTMEYVLNTRLGKRMDYISY